MADLETKLFAVITFSPSLRRISKTKFVIALANIFQFANWISNFCLFVRKSSRNTNRGFVSGQSYIYHAVLSVHNVRRVNIMHVRILFANPFHNANSVTEFDFPWRVNANANFVLPILRIKLWPIGVFKKKSIGIFCSHMHPLINHASFASMTNFGLRFTLAGWYLAAKSAKLNRQRKLVDFNTVFGFSGLL